MPGDWPLFDDFALTELREQADANMPHSCVAAATTDSGRTWSTVTGGSALPCRLTKPRPSELLGVADEIARATALHVVCFPSGSTFAGPRMRYTITGDDNGTPFTRVVYSIGILTAFTVSAEVRVLCHEDPAAVRGT
jgi:hypothetical protein